MPLNTRQKRFADEWLTDFNATRAAKAAGYSKTTAYSLGQRLLKNVEVKEYIDSKMKPVEEKLLISAERTKEEIAKVGYQNAKDLYRPDGSLIPVHELPDHVAACISGIEVEETWEWQGKKRIKVGQVTKIKRFDKNKGLEMLAKHFKIYSDAPVTNNNWSFGYGSESPV